ncbi:ATP phosphoribosyltransferase regulatory subunit [Candidatus Chloroploca mongolica]
MSGTLEVVRGMRDLLPAAQGEAIRVRSHIEAILEAYGYASVDLPIIEHRDLYQRKLGEELAGKVYEFSFGGRDLALRPEWTASVLRAYVAHLQDQPLPLRLSYSGPVFRYERPQRHTYRQFTQIGGEIIGGPAPRADAEALAVACAGLEAVGINDYRVLIGHVGLVREILAQLGLTERTQGILVWGLDRLRTRGPEVIRERLHEDNSEIPAGLELPPGIDESQSAAWLLQTLRMMELDLSTGTRHPEEIVARLLRKLRRRDEQAAIDHALTILTHLTSLSGPPATAMPAMAAMLSEYNLEAPAYQELGALVELLEAHGLDAEHIRIEAGLGRGLHYYSGMIFEIDDASGLQLCGGGRYDDLVAALGGRGRVPAVGFAYGLERVVAASKLTPPPSRRQHVLVAPVTDDDYGYAQQVARQLRAQNMIVTVDLRGRAVGRNLSDAARRGVDVVVIVGHEERQNQTLVWRELARHHEQKMSLDDLARMGQAG